MKPKKLFLDLDGVFADFKTMYESLIEIHDAEDNWQFFHKMVVEFELFTKLKTLPNAFELYEFIDGLYLEGKIKPVFLTSSGDSSGYKHAKIAAVQKEKWVREVLKSDYEVVVVNKKEHKQKFADVDSFLLDDTASNVEEFVDAGGHGFIYSDMKIQEALYAIKNWIESTFSEESATDNTFAI